MQAEHKDFIAVYKNVFPEGYCQHLVSEFDRLANSGAGANRQVSENAARHAKDDYQILLNIRNHSALNFNGFDTVDTFFDGLQHCYEDYSSKYSVIKSNGYVRATDMKLQRTDSGGGYHVWHGEQGGGVHANRVIVYMLYLNSLPKESNGETEFLYQQRRINPEENTMVLWPASYTHAHRGNPVYGDASKYIVTGWFCYE